MNNLTTVLLVILAVLVVLLVVLYFLGNRMQKRQAEQQELLDAAKQTVSILVIDKKRLPLKESGLPKQVIEQTPWYAKRSKLPIVKAKVGPRVMTLIAQDTAFEQLPVKTEARGGQRPVHHRGQERARRHPARTEEKEGLLCPDV